MSFPNSYCKQTEEQVAEVVAQAAAEDKLLATAVTDGSGTDSEGDGPGEFVCNAIRYHPTPEGLELAIRDVDNLFSRWMAAKEYRIVSQQKEGHYRLKEE